jgi:hypothetical protein
MITTFLDPAQLPSRLQEQKIFDIFMGQFMQLLPTFGGEINSALGQFNAGLAGGAYALSYVFDSATVDADPGPGKLRLSSTTQNASTVLRLDVIAGAMDVTSILDTFDASTSTVKGSIRLVKMGDLTKWLTFDVTARAAPSGYRNLTVANTGGSSASPFAAGDGVLLFFQRTGDKGDLGSGHYQLLAQSTVSTAVASIDFLNVFTSAYDKYVIELSNYSASSGGALQMRLATGGVLSTLQVYSVLAGHGGTGSVNLYSLLPIGGSHNAGGIQAGLTLEVLNVNSNTMNKNIIVRGAFTNASGNIEGVMGTAQFNQTNPVTGFSLFWASSNFAKATVRVYGVKNT